MAEASSIENMFLDCLHGRLDNPHTDLSEQLYIITKMSRHDLSEMFKKQCQEKSLPAQIRESLYEDGLPSRVAVQDWLKTYGHNYPTWGRARLPGVGCASLVLAFVAICLIAIAGPSLSVLAWIGIVSGLLIFALILRYVVNVAWRRSLIASVSRSTRDKGLASASPFSGGRDEFNSFLFYWILARRLDGDRRSSVELASEALSIWEGIQ